VLQAASPVQHVSRGVLSVSRGRGGCVRGGSCGGGERPRGAAPGACQVGRCGAAGARAQPRQVPVPERAGVAVDAVQAPAHLPGHRPAAAVPLQQPPQLLGRGLVRGGGARDTHRGRFSAGGHKAGGQRRLWTH
jgi:hypothetical protein